MAHATPQPQSLHGQANGILHRMNGGIAQMGKILLVSLLPGLTGLMHGAAPVAAVVPAGPDAQYFKTGTLMFADRIWAQTQIERVFYNKRIWPEENPGPKPPFERMVPSELISAKVEDSLNIFAALDKFWQHSVT